PQVPSHVVGDSLRLRQVLINLVGNAIKFTHQGEIFLSVQKKNSNGTIVELLFEVRDTGIGIAEDKLERLFKSFSQVDSSTTRKYGGTGLGLAISEKLIALMGGQIQVQSKLDKGTKFIFNIIVAVSQHSGETKLNLNLEDVDGKRILVVDDNETNRIILKNQLEQWKLIPVLAASGKEATLILSAQSDFDLIITDMQMPEMDGIHLALHVRKQFNIPVLLLSSMGDERAKQYGDLFCALLTKPVKQQILYTHIFSQLRQKGKPVLEAPVENKKLSEDFSQEHPLSILVAEDNPVNQKLAERVLVKLGYQPDFALNGLKALEAVDRKNYDLIFMDVQMPEMDGLEATRLIRCNRPAQPIIIAMTANAMQGDREICLQAGMNDYISKPIKFDDLIILLQKWASQGRGFPPSASSRNVLIAPALTNILLNSSRSLSQPPKCFFSVSKERSVYPLCFKKCFAVRSAMVSLL
ncbi:MAG: response regulator, partial [Bacteroidetes bacterium]|nr:response regulator [Bacteroidota bacterium]